MKHYTRRDFDKTMSNSTPDWFGGIVIGIMIMIAVLTVTWLNGGM